MPSRAHEKILRKKLCSIIFLAIIACTLLTSCAEDKTGSPIAKRDWSTETMAGLFKKKVIDEDLLLYPEVNNLKQLQQATARISMPAEYFFGAYDKVSNIHIENIKPHIARFNYDLPFQAKYVAYSYIDKANKRPQDKLADTAYLIIPGSGANEASKIFYGKDDDYHCCLRQKLPKEADLYVYVKPNNDFLAIHHKGKLLNGKVALFTQLLSMGGSYSTRYLVDAIALTKYLKNHYKKVVILGLSQGGNAALLIALQAEPDAAIVSSGYSVINSGPVYLAGINQVVIPGLLLKYTPDYINGVIAKQSTQYLFSFGSLEKGVYGHETVKKKTEQLFGIHNNARFHYHPGGHLFPTKAIISFLKSHEL